MSNKTEHNKKALIQALTKTRGIVTTACEMCSVGRTTYYEYYNSDPKFKKDVDSLSDLALDFAESKLMEKMDGVQIGKYDKDGELIVYNIPPSDTALIFYLKTKGQKRGYIEKQQILIEKLPTIKIVDGTNDNSDPNLQGKQPKQKKDKP